MLFSFSTQAPAAGAIVVEWNVAGDAPGNAGTWDTHIRIGGAAGTNTLIAQCPAGNQNFASCSAAFLSLHLTKTSSAYLEGLWAWVADHDAEDQAQGQTGVFAGRGILSESQGPVWMVGTASEHAALYQYALVDAKNHYMGLIQTETVSSNSQIHRLHGLTLCLQPYYQPSPVAPAPFSVNAVFHDPATTQSAAWGLWVENSQNIFIYGAGHYSVRLFALAAVVRDADFVACSSSRTSMRPASIRRFARTRLSTSTRPVASPSTSLRRSVLSTNFRSISKARYSLIDLDHCAHINSRLDLC
jgi:hypothetical protein